MIDWGKHGRQRQSGNDCGSNVIGIVNFDDLDVDSNKESFIENRKYRNLCTKLSQLVKEHDNHTIRKEAREKAKLLEQEKKEKDEKKEKKRKEKQQSKKRERQETEAESNDTPILSTNVQPNTIPFPEAPAPVQTFVQPVPPIQPVPVAPVSPVAPISPVAPVAPVEPVTNRVEPNVLDQTNQELVPHKKRKHSVNVQVFADYPTANDDDINDAAEVLSLLRHVPVEDNHNINLGVAKQTQLQQQPQLQLQQQQQLQQPQQLQPIDAVEMEKKKLDALRRFTATFFKNVNPNDIGMIGLELQMFDGDFRSNRRVVSKRFNYPFIKKI